MKIGILAQYLDTRTDVREIVAILAKEHEVTVYIKKNDYNRIAPLLPVGLRVVAIPVPSFLPKILLLLWQYTYLAFGRIPASQYNYYMVEHIRLRNKGLTPFTRNTQAFLVALSKYVPQFISYDAYLKGMRLLPSPVIIDPTIECFWCNTQIYDDHLYAHLLRQNKPLWTYVYSWDHPCKMKTFSNHTHYLVWNEGLKEDLIQLQGIRPELITIWGTTQFTYIEQYHKINRATERPYPFPYIYLGFATGYDELVEQEVSYVVDIAQQMAKAVPNWKLVLVRPYPFQKQVDLYTPLQSLSNVVFDDYIANSTTHSAVDSIFEKYTKIEHAEAFFHFGTTMGYEVCYFNTPSCLIAHVDPQKDYLLYGFVHQYQNDKYLNSTNSLNVVENDMQLQELLLCIREHSERLSAYSERIQKLTPLKSMEEMVDTLIRHLFPKQTTSTL